MNRKLETDRTQTSTDGPTLPSALFDGYDTFANARRTSAVSGTPQSPTNGGMDASLSICIGQEQVMEKIDFLASVSSNFGFGAVDARAEFIQKFNITETSVVVLINAYKKAVVNENTVKLQSDLPADPLTLFKQHGDSYVTSLTTGSSYCALWVFYATTEEEQTTVTGKLSASSISEDGYTSGSAQASLDTVQKDISITSSFDHQIFGFAELPPPVSGDIVAWSKTFPNLVPDAPITYAFDTAHYEDLGVPSFDAIKASRALFLGGGPENPGIAGYYQGLLEQGAAVSDIETVYASYGYDVRGDQALLKRGQDIENDTQSLYDTIAALEDDPTQTPQNWTPPASAGYGMPSLNVAVLTLGRTGGTSGAPFQDIQADAVAARVILNDVAVAGFSHLHGIESTYGIRDPQTGTLQPFPTIAHGSQTGIQPNDLKLQKGEFVNYVEVTSSWDNTQQHHIVQQVVLRTTLGNSLVSPSNAPTVEPSAPYPWTAAPNQALLGFFGSAGEEINALGMVVATFSPANWTLPPAMHSRPRRRDAALRQRSQLNA